MKFVLLALLVLTAVSLTLRTHQSNWNTFASIITANGGASTGIILGPSGNILGMAGAHISISSAQALAIVHVALGRGAISSVKIGYSDYRQIVYHSS